ncbi:hypothetical protein RN629_04565 [Sphingomonadaceae bacterium jetA1]|jgi:quercetin dioxygenase-like cupin family protein|uniref:hypothetical protein n=1 Tax=Facivitalis istanbulensis TaxID=3075838 RepID=UPI0034957B9C
MLPRRILRHAVLAGLALTPALAAPAFAAEPPAAGHDRIHAFRLYTGPDGNSHVEEGTVTPGVPSKVEKIHFKTTAARSHFDWHNDPEPQYVLTLSGTLKFATRTGESFTLRPGDVLVAEDHTGTGHNWVMQGDQPWNRAYVVLAQGAQTSFVADPRH